MYGFVLLFLYSLDAHLDTLFTIDTHILIKQQQQKANEAIRQSHASHSYEVAKMRRCISCTVHTNGWSLAIELNDEIMMLFEHLEISYFLLFLAASFCPAHPFHLLMVLLFSRSVSHCQCACYHRNAPHTRANTAFCLRKSMNRLWCRCFEGVQKRPQTRRRQITEFPCIRLWNFYNYVSK